MKEEDLEQSRDVLVQRLTAPAPLVIAVAGWHHRIMSWRVPLGLAFTGSLMLACGGEAPEEKPPAQLTAGQQDPGEQRPPGEPDTAGDHQTGDPRTGGKPGGAALPPWLANPECKKHTTSIYYTGIITDMSAGVASCSRRILVCSDSIRTDKVYNYKRGEKCPWSDSTTIAYREDGGAVCCDEWHKAKQSKTPCDPLADADCDGIPNDDDADTLSAAKPATD